MKQPQGDRIKRSSGKVQLLNALNTKSLLIIFSYLTAPDLLTLRTVCKDINSVARESLRSRTFLKLDRGMQPISNFELIFRVCNVNLRHLVLDRPLIEISVDTEELIFQSLQTATFLEVLELRDFPDIPIRNYYAQVEHPGVKELRLWNCSRTLRTNFPKLEKLAIESCADRFGDVGNFELVELYASKLREFGLNQVFTTDLSYEGALLKLNKLTNLNKLTLRTFKGRQLGVLLIQLDVVCGRIVALDIAYNIIDETVIQALGSYQQLSALHLGYSYIDDDTLLLLSQSIPHLRRIYLTHAEVLTEEGIIKYIENARCIRFIDCRQTNIRYQSLTRIFNILLNGSRAKLAIVMSVPAEEFCKMVSFPFLGFLFIY